MKLVWLKINFTKLWYLVKYENDDNLRVLGQDDIRHICPDDEDVFQVGNIISAMWLPNGQFYDAQVLQIEVSSLFLQLLLSKAPIIKIFMSKKFLGSHFINHTYLTAVCENYNPTSTTSPKRKKLHSMFHYPKGSCHMTLMMKRNYDYSNST